MMLKIMSFFLKSVTRAWSLLEAYTVENWQSYDNVMVHYPLTGSGHHGLVGGKATDPPPIRPGNGLELRPGSDVSLPWAVPDLTVLVEAGLGQLGGGVTTFASGCKHILIYSLLFLQFQLCVVLVPLFICALTFEPKLTTSNTMLTQTYPLP